MRTRRRKQSGIKSKLINQAVICVLLIISVMCIKSVNNNSVLIKNIRDSLNTSIDYKKTADSIKNMFSRLINEGEITDDTKNEQQPVAPDSVGETL